MSDFGISLDDYQRPEDAALNIKVSDPIHQGEGIGKYTLYRVQYMEENSQQDGGSNDGGTLVDGYENGNNGDGIPATSAGAIAAAWVLRRYSDFVWLYERLQKERAGAIISPPPEKMSGSQRFSPDFLEERRWQLERFLRWIWIHPELHDSPSLDIFLRADELSFHAARHARGRASELMIQSTANLTHSTTASMSSAMPPLAVPKAHGMKKWIAKAKTSVTKDLVQSAEDELIDEIERYIDALDKQMRTISSMASTLVKRARQSSNEMSDLGVAIHTLSRHEADSPLGLGLDHMGNTVDQQSTLTIQYAQEEVRQFEEPLKDYVQLIAAVKIALHKRQDKRVNYTTWLSSIANKQTTLNKLKNIPGSEAKAFGVETALQRKQTEAESIREEYEVVSQRLIREFDRFKREKVGQMKQIILNYTKIQVSYNRRMEQNWANLIPQLQNIPLDNQPPILPKPPQHQLNGMMSDNVITSDSPYPNHAAAAAAHPQNNNIIQSTTSEHHHFSTTSSSSSLIHSNSSHLPIAPIANHETFAENCMANVGAIQYRNQPATGSFLNGI